MQCPFRWVPPPPPVDILRWWYAPYANGESPVGVGGGDVMIREMTLKGVKVNLISQPSIDPATQDALIETARAAAKHAYAPYSDFPVGAAVLTADGTIISGANVENASFGLTICAERVAVFTAIAASHRVIRAVCVTAPKASGVTPCGACRQVLREFSPPESDVIVILDNVNRPESVPLAELLPRSFGPSALTSEQG